MRRFTDFFVMLAILVLNIIVSLVLWNTVDTGADPESMTLSYSVLRLSIVAIPGMALAAGLALARALWGLAPRIFYASLFTGGVIAITLTWFMSVVFRGDGPISSLYLNDTVFALGVLSVAAIVGAVLGLTGAVPSPAKKVGEPVKETPSAPKSGRGANPSKTAPKRGDEGTTPSKVAPSNNKGMDTTGAPESPRPGTSASANPRTVTPDALDE